MAVFGGILFIFGGYTLYSGVLNFFMHNGDIAAPITVTAANSAGATETALKLPLFNATADIPPRLPTHTPVKPCQAFRVNVVKALVRECAKDTCPTLEAMYSQGALVCVLGPAADSTDWLEINLRPESLYPELAYMHSSVLDAVHPTPRPTRTPTGLPTVTPVPTARPSRTPTPLPIAKQNATASAVAAPLTNTRTK